MPSLATLQRRFGSNDFEVVAVSVDKGGAKAAAPFLQETKASELRLYVDPTGKSIEMLTALGLPATVLIDREGKEIGRLLARRIGRAQKPTGSSILPSTRASRKLIALPLCISHRAG